MEIDGLRFEKGIDSKRWKLKREEMEKWWKEVKRGAVVGLGFKTGIEGKENKEGELNLQSHYIPTVEL